MSESEDQTFEKTVAEFLSEGLHIIRTLRIAEAISLLRIRVAGGRHDPFQPHVDHQVAIVLQVV